MEQAANWHFINTPYVEGPVVAPIQPPGTEYNVVWAIEQARNVLSNPDSSTLDKARQLRFLLHFVGDIHQPLHTASLYSAQFPDGDRGGNNFIVNGGNVSNLHEFYDSGAGHWATPYVHVQCMMLMPCGGGDGRRHRHRHRHRP